MIVHIHKTTYTYILGREFGGTSRSVMAVATGMPEVNSRNGGGGGGGGDGGGARADTPSSREMKLLLPRIWANHGLRERDREIDTECV
ncbi:hypothetical protein M0804_011367 [Polistes exclamans]|nr:hypothetical protein M0804_011367 [Polistes exclamans]